ncbi:MAG: HEAT repeat domain-containing protein [Elusimicrobia bacterium]|nr:HEAT repeat domain-containing protein [Elusimicrobiota bacterium]
MNPVFAVFLLLWPPIAFGAQVYSDKELGTKALETVIADIKDKDSDIRAMAAGVLGNAGNKAAVGILTKLLNDPDKHVRITAAEALWKLDSPAGMKIVYAIINDVPAKEPVDHSPMIELKTIFQNKIREHAIEAVVRMKGEKAGDLLFSLKNDVFGAVRDVAARELSRLGYDEEMTQFIDALSSENEAIRYQSATVFSKICSAAALPKLKELLGKETSLMVKTAVLDAIACIPERKSATEALMALADDDNPTVKYKAIVALAGIKDKKVSAKLAEINSETGDIKLKLAILPALISPSAGNAMDGQAGGAAGKPELETVSRALEARNPEVKISAVRALENFNPQEAKPLLGAALADENASVKLEAALQILRRFSKK